VHHLVQVICTVQWDVISLVLNVLDVKMDSVETNVASHVHHYVRSVLKVTVAYVLDVKRDYMVLVVRRHVATVLVLNAVKMEHVYKDVLLDILDLTVSNHVLMHATKIICV